MYVFLCVCVLMSLNVSCTEPISKSNLIYVMSILHEYVEYAKCSIFIYSCLYAYNGIVMVIYI